NVNKRRLLRIKKSPACRNFLSLKENANLQIRCPLLSTAEIKRGVCDFESPGFIRSSFAKPFLSSKIAIDRFRDRSGNWKSISGFDNSADEEYGGNCVLFNCDHQVRFCYWKRL